MSTEVEESPGRRIAIAVDRSDESVDALKWALEKVCRKGDKLVVLHATCPLEEPHIYEMDFMFHKSPTACHMLDDLAQKEEREARALVEKCKKLADQAKVQCDTLIEEGDPREVICTFVAAYEPDVLVVASRGPSTILNRALLGSTCDYVVKHAGCPVLVARPTSHTLEKRKKDALLHDRFGLTSWAWGGQPDESEEGG
ncbi:universal stress protein family protein [Klebsormidium nitens]|uniref:Universal stress protein family protein n=1 Tax=Klebsormidium nitens TaxID=105231 RepID=A0A1Y1I2Z0_KLENI|nr:universal stress protein family protein [Klebsormidium nitens]|eukprot:GAQ83779.1 universal stress protein family protein [Klebsormidium nitens]